MKPFKNIAVSSGNYLELKKLGFAGDSFNDVITELIQDRKNKAAAVGSGLSPQDQLATGTKGEQVPNGY